MFNRDTLNTKTFRTSIAGLLALVGAVLTGEMMWVDALQAAIPLIVATTVRDGMVSHAQAK